MQKKTSNARPVSRGGRPRKFKEASRPVTVTLPDSTLLSLEQIDPDRAKAIVKAAAHLAGKPSFNDLEVEVVRLQPGCGLIFVGSCRYLREVDFLRVVPVDTNRNLISIPAGTATTSVEVALLDLLEEIPPFEVRERRIISKLADIFRTTRRSNKMIKEEILLVPLP